VRVQFPADVLGEYRGPSKQGWFGAVKVRFEGLENILLSIAQKSEEFELLNVIVDPVEEVREKLSKLPPHKLRELDRRRRTGE